MFISQVIFETEKMNEDVLKKIMKKKLTSALSASGIVSGECWVTEKKDTIGYALVTKWENKECFQSWFLADHKKRPHDNNQRDGSKPKLTKTGYQFEVANID